MSKSGTVMCQCARCQHIKLHHARGLCKCCYNHAAEKRQLDLYARRADWK